MLTSGIEAVSIESLMVWAVSHSGILPFGSPSAIRRSFRELLSKTLITSAMAWFECEVEDSFPIGDHTMIVGRVLDGRIEKEAEPMTSGYTGWTYSG